MSEKNLKMHLKKVFGHLHLLKETSYVNVVLTGLYDGVVGQFLLYLWSQTNDARNSAAAHEGRQGPRLSIRIDIWILQSDTIRG